MMKKLSEKELVFIRNLLLTTMLGGLVGILNYLFNIFIARYTDQNTFSIFSSALGVTYLLQIPAVAIQALITKEVAGNKEKDLHRFKWNSFFVFSTIGLVSSVLFFLLKVPVSDLASIPTETVIFLAITLFFAFASPIAKGLLLGLEKITLTNVIIFAETVLRFGMGALAIRLGGSMSLLILASSLPAIISTLFIMPLLKLGKGNGEKVKINLKELLQIGASFLLLTTPFTLALVLVNPSFRAEYAALSLLGKLVYFASITTASVLLARLTNEREEGSQKKSLLLSLALSISIGLFLSLVFFLFGDFVVTMSVGVVYLPIVKYIGVFALCMTAFASVYMVANFFISRNSYNYLWILFVVTLIQVLSFVFRNDSLDMVIQNQVFVYGLLSLLTLIYFLINFKRVKDGRQEKDSGKE